MTLILGKSKMFLKENIFFMLDEEKWWWSFDLDLGWRSSRFDLFSFQENKNSSEDAKINIFAFLSS